MVDTSEFEAYVVGGFVRDRLLGCEPNDRDIVVVGATEEDMLQAGFEQPVGESFAVFIHPETEEEWALARKETSTGDKIQDFDVTADGSVSLKEDLMRRDLTVNAMAMDPDTEEIIDPFSGQDDLEQRVFRHVSDAFVEDPLRVVRVATFMARYDDFTVAPETAEMCRNLHDKLESIAPQRINKELLKAFRKAEAPRRFFDTLDEVGALDILFPRVADLKEVPAGPEEYHGEGSAYEHTMMVLEEAHNIDPNNIRLMLAALSHDFGKTQTPEDKLPSHPQHMKTGVPVVEEMVDEIEMQNDHERVMKDAVRKHMKVHQMDEFNDSTLVRFIDNQMDEGGLTIQELLDLARADSLGREPAKDPDMTEINRLIELAKEAVTSIDGYDVMDKFDVEPSEGLKIRDLLIQERTKKFRELKD